MVNVRLGDVVRFFDPKSGRTIKGTVRYVAVDRIVDGQTWLYLEVGHPYRPLKYIIEEDKVEHIKFANYVDSRQF